MTLAAATAAEDLPHQPQETPQNLLTQRGIDMVGGRRPRARLPPAHNGSLCGWRPERMTGFSRAVGPGAERVAGMPGARAQPSRGRRRGRRRRRRTARTATSRRSAARQSPPAGRAGSCRAERVPLGQAGSGQAYRDERPRPARPGGSPVRPTPGRWPRDAADRRGHLFAAELDTGAPDLDAGPGPAAPTAPRVPGLTGWRICCGRTRRVGV